MILTRYNIICIRKTTFKSFYYTLRFNGKLLLYDFFHDITKDNLHVFFFFYK